MAEAEKLSESTGGGIDHVPSFDKSKRKCTDVFCCLLFIVFWIGMVVIAGVAASEGDIARLMYGTNNEGKTCGTGSFEGKKYVAYPRLSEDVRAAAVEIGTQDNPASMAEVADNLDKLHLFGICADSCPQAGDKLKDSEGTSYTFYLNTRSILFRCFPVYNSTTEETSSCVGRDKAGGCEVKNVIETVKTTKLAEENYAIDKFNGFYAKMSSYFGDLVKSWYVVLVAGIVLAFVVGFAFLFLMKWCAGIIVWGIIFLLILGCFGITFYAYLKAGLVPEDLIQTTSSKLPGNYGNSTFSFLEGDTSKSDSETVFRYGAYILTVLDIVFILVIIGLRSRIHLAIAIVKEASKAVADMPYMVLFPFVTMLFVSGLAIYWLFISALIMSASSTEPTTLTGPNGENVTITLLNNDEATNYMVIYHFFGLLWTNNFFQGIGSMTLAGCVGMWYFTTSSGAHKDAAPEGAQGWRRLWFFYTMVLRYHLGTIAFGAALIAIVQFLRAVLYYIDHKTQDLQQKYTIVKVLMKSVHCCLWCFQKCLEYVSSLAYTFTILYGVSFCTAGMHAIKLVMNNILRVSTINTISYLVTLAGRVFVTTFCGVASFVWVDSASNFAEGGSDELSSEWLPVLFTMIVAFFISSTFFNVYDLTIDTILLCFCQDEKLSGEIHAGKNLAPILDSAERQAKTESGKGEEKSGDEGEAVAVA